MQNDREKRQKARVPRQKCSSCGEEYFDREANTILDRYRKTAVKNVKIAA